MRAQPQLVGSKPFASLASLSREVTKVLANIGETQDLKSSCASDDYDFLLEVVRRHPDAANILAQVTRIELKLDQKAKMCALVHSQDGGGGRDVEIHRVCVYKQEENSFFSPGPLKFLDMSQAQFQDE